MNKKILIGSMLVLTLLLLMPSIPAIQLNTIKDKAFSDLVEYDSNYSGKLNQQELDRLIISIKEKLVNVDLGGDIGVLTPGWDIIMMLIGFLVYIFDYLMENGIIKTIIETIVFIMDFLIRLPFMILFQTLVNIYFLLLLLLGILPIGR